MKNILQVIIISLTTTSAFAQINHWETAVYNSKDLLGSNTFSIVNALGQAIETFDKFFVDNSGHIDVSNYPKGTYYIVFKMNKEVKTRKFVVMR